MPKKAFFTRRRAGLLILLAASVGGFFAAASALKTLLTRQRLAERRAVEKSADEMLAVSRRLADGYIADRLSARDKLRRQLTRQATALCGEVQVFLQAALIGREAKDTQERLNAEQRKRGRLQELARGQLQIISQLAERVRGLEQQTAENHFLISNTPTITTVDSGQDGGTGENSDSAAAAGVENPPLPDGSAEKKILDQLEVAEPEKPADPEWAEKLLSECSLDFKNLLPKNCALVIAEVGKQVLLTFGDGAVRDGEVRGEAAIPLLIRNGGDHRHWMLTLILAEIDAPAVPEPEDMARFIGERLDAGGRRLRSFVLDAAGREVAAVYPRTAGEMRPLLPENKTWVEAPEAELAVYYRTLTTPSADKNYPWLLGLQVTIDQPRDIARLGALAAAYPLSAAGFVFGCLLLIGALAAAAALGWNSSAPVYVAAGAGTATGGAEEHLTPELGSVARLQAANRHQAPASNILATARSKLLRDLAVRISPPAVRPAPKGLREYRS